MIYQVDLAQYYMPDHLIIPLITLREGAPFDQGIVIDKKFYKVQVKTTEKIENGCMTFTTSHKNGQKYTPEEVDLFLLHYLGQPSWYGLALPSECGLTTRIYTRATNRDSSYNAEDFDFFKRIRELAETGSVLPISYEEPAPLPDPFKRPKTSEEMYGLLCDYGYNLNAISFEKRVSIPTLHQWIQELM